MNSLKSIQPKDAAALRLQLAWNHKCDEIVYRTTQTDEESIKAVEEASSPKRGHAVMSPPSPQPSVPKPVTRQETRLRPPVANGPVDVNQLVSRLDKVDELMSRLEAIVSAQSNRTQKKAAGITTPK